MIDAKENLPRFVLAAALLILAAMTAVHAPPAMASGSALGHSGSFSGSPVQDPQSPNPDTSTPSANTESEEKVDKKKRMALVGSGCFAVLGGVAILFGYFRLNHATRGFYAGRLQTLALFLLIGWLGLAIWLAQKFGF